MDGWKEHLGLIDRCQSCCTRSLPHWLTCFPEKLEHYVADQHFLHGWATILDLQRRGVLAVERFWTLGSVLFKADTTLRGNGRIGIRFLEEHGFRICAVRTIGFSGDLVEDLWRYSLGRLSRERVQLLKRLQTAAPSLYVIVQSAHADSLLPSSVQVTELKGQVDLTKRHVRTLRYAMGNPQSAFFNFVHTADEPSDLIRELGLLFDPAERSDLILEAISGSKADAEGAYDALATTFLRSDLDASCALQRLRSLVIAADGLPSEERAELLEATDRVLETGYEFWCRTRDDLVAHGIRIEEIDDIVITGKLVPVKQTVPVQPFPSCEARHWKHHPVLTVPHPVHRND